jgi:hypothetical protein
MFAKAWFAQAWFAQACNPVLALEGLSANAYSSTLLFGHLD